MEKTSPDLPEAQWTGSPILGEARQPWQVVQQARYLGVTFQAGKGCLPTFAGLLSKALRGLALLWHQYGRSACGRSMWLMLQSYQACVVPAGHFACEVWGVLPLRPAVLLGRRGQFGRFAPATSQEACGPQADGAYSHDASRVAAVLSL